MSRTKAVADRANAEFSDGLDRNVYGFFGIPLDGISFYDAVSKIDESIGRRHPLYLSTPNVNFLVLSWTDPTFRDALLASDLCPPDGMPIVWIARFLRIPLTTRVAGADIFAALKRRDDTKQLKVFLFGGGEGVARSVAHNINAEGGGLRCVGELNPGFVSVDEMSRKSVISEINRSGADFLCVFLSASKAQSWLLRNYSTLFPPVRVQLGATVNFEAGTVRRAPPFLRKLGCEWLWRIKEEPYLWRRYGQDGLQLVRLLATSVLPLTLWHLWMSMRNKTRHMQVATSATDDKVIVRLDGDAVADFIADGIVAFRAALASNKHIEIDVSQLRSLDHRYLGLFLMVRKNLSRDGRKLTFCAMSASTRAYFRLNRFDYLIAQ